MNTHALPSGTTLREDNGYIIDQVLGQGGFGITYKAIDQLGRPVAIKEFFPSNFCFRQQNAVIKIPGYTGVFDFDKYREDFFDEARTLTGFDHPNIVKILDAFKANNTAYFVMQFEEGQTLQEILSSKLYLSEAETVKFMKEIGQALEYIHKQGTLHRDIKPSNIIVRKNGKPILIDFGAARKVIHGNEEHTAILSHGFAPPEQYDKSGKKGDFIDVYGLGATCYCCLTGSVPLRADHRIEHLMPEPNSINPKISDEMNGIIVKALELESDKRYQSISKFLYDLTSVTSNEEEDHDLTESQKNGLNVINHFVNDEETNVLILSGTVSTGKTTLIKKYLAQANQPNITFKVLVAGSRIAEQLMSGSGLEAFSIYRHIYNFSNTQPIGKTEIENIDLEKGEVSESDIKRSHFPLRSNTDGKEVVYIIDEAQLLSDSFSENELFIFGSGKLLNDLIEFIDFKRNQKRKLVIVGDDRRLSRGANDESSLSKAHLTNIYKLKAKEFELNETIYNDRQKSILRFASSLSAAIKNGVFNDLKIEEDQATIYKIHRNEFPQHYQKLDSINQCIFLTYSNRHALDVNLSIRKEFLGRTTILEKGDLVIFNNTVSVSNSIEGLFPLQLYKGEIAEILSVGEEQVKNVYLRGKPVVRLVFRNVKVSIQRLHRTEEVTVLDNYLRQEKDLTKDERLALLLLAKNNFKERVGANKVTKAEFTTYLKSDPFYNSALVKYAYSMTCHKANGLHWKYVFINCETDKGKDNEEFFRWLYTAISTAKSRIYLVGFAEINAYIKIEWKERLEVFDRFAKVNVNSLNGPFDIVVPETLATEVYRLKFPGQFPSLSVIWYLISSRLSPYQIRVTKIEHHTYQELYTFADDSGQVAKIRFHYNAQGKVTKSTPYPRNDFSNLIIKLIETENSNIDTKFPQIFLENLYIDFSKVLGILDIKIASIEHEKHHEKYRIVQDEQFIQLSIYYNDEGFITTFLPIRYNSETLYKKVKDVVESNLKRPNA